MEPVFHGMYYHDIWVIFENLLRKFKFHSIRTNIKGTLHEDQYTFSILARAFLLRMKNVSNKNCIETRNTHFTFKFFLSKIVPLWDNAEKYCRAGQMTKCRMRIACWILKATNTYTDFAIHIAFPQQQWLQDRASMFRYTYNACLISTVYNMAAHSLHQQRWPWNLSRYSDSRQAERSGDRIPVGVEIFRARP